MKTKSFRYTGIILAVLLLFAVGPVQGQEPEPEPEEDPGDAEFVLAQPPYTMNYQGYLTDSNGTPLNGAYDLVFRLYDAASGGTSEWGPETHNSTQVTNGLFQVTLGSSVALEPNDFDEALFLAVQVEGTWLTTRQPLHAVPYAFGLVPGAEVQGNPNSGDYGLRVDNTGTGATDRGIYARGNQYGLYAYEDGGGDVAIKAAQFVEAAGYKSTNDTYLWVPGIAAATTSSNCSLSYSYHGYMRMQCSGAGTKSVYIPITIPSVLQGQEVTVENLTVYYDLDDAGSYITTTRLRRQTSATTSDSLVYSAVDRTSTSPSSYSMNTSGNTKLSSGSGGLIVYFGIIHDGNTTHDVLIGGVRLRLGHTDD